MKRMLFFSVLMLGIILVPYIGPAWDEPDNIVAAGQYAKFFQQGFDGNILSQKDQDASIFGHVIYTQESAIARYPPIPYYLGTIIAVITHAQTSQQIFIAFHVATALFFALLVATVYAWGQLLGLSRSTSLFAALITFLYPTLFGHGLSNLKDTAQVSLFTLSLYFLVRFSLSSRPSLSRPTAGSRDLIAGTIIWGLALASKFNAIYVPIIWTIWMVLSRKKFSLLTSHFLLLTSLGLLTAFAVWPYLWFDPVNRILEVVHYFTTVGQGYKIFWNGVMYTVGVGKALWWYPWTNLLYTTPPVLTILWAFGIVNVIRHPRQRILAIWFVLPLLRAFFPNAAFYDGVRHFLETLPAGTLIVAVGFAQLVKFVKLDKLDKLGKTILATLIVGQLLYINMTYFPYSTGYLNGLAQNPNDRFDRDIEALSVKESVDYLHKKYGSIHVWAHIGGHLSWHYLVSPDHYTYPEGADSIIIVNKASHIRQGGPYLPVSPEFRLDHIISRNDAIFAWIYRRK